MNKRTEHIDEEIVEDDAADNLKEVKEVLSDDVDSKETEALKEPRESAGVVLKRERESQGLSLEIVHEATKIPMDALRAIEEGYTVRTLSPFYYDGFIKMYAQYLHIDASDVIDDYKQENLPEHIEQDVEEKFEIPLWVSKIFSRENKQKMVIAVGALLAVFLISKTMAFFMAKMSQKEVKDNNVRIEAVKKEVKKVIKKPRLETRQQPPKIITPKSTPKVTLPKPKLIKPKPIVASVAPIAAIEKNIRLTVRANQNCWMRVKVDNEIVFQSTLRQGAVETWLADDEIEISGRNINQLDFELNGKLIGTLGRKDRNAKKVVITKNGLSVKQ